MFKLLRSIVQENLQQLKLIAQREEVRPVPQVAVAFLSGALWFHASMQRQCVQALKDKEEVLNQAGRLRILYLSTHMKTSCFCLVLLFDADLCGTARRPSEDQAHFWLMPKARTELEAEYLDRRQKRLEFETWQWDVHGKLK